MIHNGKIENVQILMSDGVFRRGSIEFDEKIKNINVCETGGTEVGPYLIPGLVDIHTHGALGGGHIGDSKEKTQEMAKFYAKNGTTSFLASTVTATEDVLTKAMKNIGEYRRQKNGARCLGINMEGPYFSHGKRGAHPPELLRNPDISMFMKLNEASGGAIKIVCVAPELGGGMDFIKEVAKTCVVSVAHTEADYKTAMEAFSCGATHVTHLFNGMNPFLHREPGVLGAALDANAFVEIISDGFHLHPAVIRAAFNMFTDRVCLISDSIDMTGLPDGDYISMNMPVTVVDGKVMLRDSNTLAGSSITLMQGVRVATGLGIPLCKAVMAASRRSAEAIGVENEVGSLQKDCNADMVLLDSKLNIEKVYIGGKVVE